jgi:MFS family permease
LIFCEVSSVADTVAVVSAAAEPPATRSRPGLLVALLASSGIVVSLMQSAMVPLVPQLPRLVHASRADTIWAVTATLLAATVATPVAGRLGDMYGKRRVLLVSLGLLVTGALVIAWSNSLVPLVIGRALQGLAAGVIPLGISVMRDALPAERVGAATATMSSSLGIGAALGLPLAAFLDDHADWHVLFWLAGALGFVAIVLVASLVPESSQRTGGPFDLVGAVGLSAGSLCVLLAISKGTDWGWTSPAVLGLVGAALVVLPAWAWWELRANCPLVDLRTTARRQLMLTNLASAMLGFALYANTLALPQVLQLPRATGFGLGQSLQVVGLVLAPQGLVMMVVSPRSARLSAARGPRVTLMLGAALVALAYLTGIVMMSAIWQLVLVACLVGAGIGLAYGAMPMLVMAAVPRSETAAANGLNTLMRSLGGSVASAVIGVVLAHLTVRLGSTTVPSREALRLVLTVGATAAVGSVALAACLRPARS